MYRPTTLTLARIAGAIAMSLACTACNSPHRSPLLHRSDRADLPLTLGFVICSSPAILPTVLEAREDVVVKASPWWRLGNGSASVRVSDAKGRTMRGVESGGMLFVTGDSGPCHVELRNELDRPAEFVVSANGRDLLDGKEISFTKPGIKVDAGATKTLPSFAFATISGPEAMLRASLAAQPGVIRIAVYPSTRLAPRLPRSTARLPTGGPQLRHQPAAVLYDYR